MSSDDCRLKKTIGIAETCPQERCGLWEPLEGRFVPTLAHFRADLLPEAYTAPQGTCPIERLGLEHAVEDRQVASWLLDLRERLEGATEAGTQRARKQSLYREVNERIEAFALDDSSAGFVCECVREECDKRVPLTLEEYERIRSSPNRFVVLAGHQDSEVEGVVEANGRYLVVETLGAGAAVAEALDPRTRRARRRERV
jgi:hypothetical protein